MPFFIPFAVGGLVLTALGLGAKRVLDEGSLWGLSLSEAPEVRDARERHRQALAKLRAARLRVRDGLTVYGERQARAHAEVVEPFRALLSRLERWGHAREAEVLAPDALEALRALPPESPSRAARRPWPLLGAGAVAPPDLIPVLTWLERGWLEEEAPPVMVDGASLFEAAAPVAAREPRTPEEAVRALDEAAAVLARATGFLGETRERLEALDARVAGLHARASVQLAYLDPASFDEGGAEPRERLLRLGALVGRLVVVLRAPVLEPDGRLAPRLSDSAEDGAPPQS